LSAGLQRFKAEPVSYCLERGIFDRKHLSREDIGTMFALKGA